MIYRGVGQNFCPQCKLSWRYCVCNISSSDIGRLSQLVISQS